MAFEALPPAAGLCRIEGFRGGRFVVSGKLQPGAIVICGSLCAATGAAPSADAVAPLLGEEPPAELLLIGTGKTLRWPGADTLAALRNIPLGVEVMTSKAAARTYNLLLAEGRAVGAHLQPF